MNGIMTKLRQTMLQAILSISRYPEAEIDIISYLRWSEEYGEIILEQIENAWSISDLSPDVMMNAVEYLTHMLEDSLDFEINWSEALDWLYLIPERLCLIMQRKGLAMDQEMRKKYMTETPTGSHTYQTTMHEASLCGSLCC